MLHGVAFPHDEIALPARALCTRLKCTADSTSSWASYLPPLLLKQPSPHGDEAKASPQLNAIVAESAATKDMPEQFQASDAWWFGRIWTLSRDKFGCRDVQDALQGAESDTERLSIALELRGHIHEALRCPHANFVLQKCISMLSPNDLTFIVDELLSKSGGPVTQAAKHKYGCRIIQRLLERVPEAQISVLVDDIFLDALATTLHPYGNYVMQHLLEYGSPSCRQHLITNVLAQHAGTVGMDAYGCAVVSKAFVHGSSQEQVYLAQSLLQARGSLAFIARSRHATCTKAILQSLSGVEYDAAQSIICAETVFERKDAVRSHRSARMSVSRHGGVAGGA